MRRTCVEHELGMAVRGVDHDQIGAGIDQTARRARGPKSPTLVAAATRKRPCSSLQALGCSSRLLDVLDRDQPDAAIVVVDHEQLLDAMLVQEPLRLLQPDALLDGDEPLLGHQLGDALVRVGGEAHVAIGEDADQPALAAAV